jgi:hypothetical protein
MVLLHDARRRAPMSVELDRIDNRVQRGTIEQSRRVGGEPPRDPLLLPTVEGRRVRTHQDAGVRPQRRVLRERLHLEDVQRGEGDRAVVERLQQRRLVDDAAASDAGEDQPGRAATGGRRR